MLCYNVAYHTGTDYMTKRQGKRMPRKSLAERKAELEKRRQEITAQLATLNTREKLQERKKETRQKIVVGGAVLAHARLDPDFAATLTDILEKAVTRDADKDTIADLLKKTETEESQTEKQKPKAKTA